MARNALWSSSSPMGAMQSVGGAMILVRAIALCSASASARSIACGRRLVSSRAFLQTSAAVRVETRLNSAPRKPDRLRLLVSRSICIITPSSTP